MSTQHDERQRALRSDSIRGEGAFLPINTVHQIHDLRRAIISAGESHVTANGVIGWLLAKDAGEPDNTSADTRSRYRKILAGIDPPGGSERSPIIHDVATVAGAAA